MAVRNFFNRMKFWKRTIDYGDIDQGLGISSPENLLANRLKRYEKYVALIQSIILWDSPVVSILCIIWVNILFWVFVSLECRFFGMLCFALLVVATHDAWTQQIWPEISVAHPPPTSDSDVPPHPSVVALSRVMTSCSAHVRLCLVWLRSLRMQQPGTFSSLCLLGCGSVFVLGRSVSGLLLVYALLMAALVCPVFYKHCVPDHLKTSVARHVVCVQQAFAKYSAESDDEYLPVTTSEDLVLLSTVSDMDMYDSITNPERSLSEMVPVLGMPSHEEDSMGNLSDLELATNILSADHDSDSNPDDLPIQGGQFQSGHFNGGDSSSDDSDMFARDLEFTETDERDGGTAAARGLTSYISQAVASNMLGSVGLLASVMRPRQPRRRHSDSDSEDFEIINRDELSDQ